MNNSDLFNMMGNPGLMNKFDELQRMLKHRTFAVNSSNNMVKITFNYQQEVIDFHIDNRLLDPSKAGVLKSSLVEAVNQGLAEARNRMVNEAQKLLMNP